MEKHEIHQSANIALNPETKPTELYIDLELLVTLISEYMYVCMSERMIDRVVGSIYIFIYVYIYRV